MAPAGRSLKLVHKEKLTSNANPTYLFRFEVRRHPPHWLTYSTPKPMSFFLLAFEKAAPACPLLPSTLRPHDEAVPKGLPTGMLSSAPGVPAAGGAKDSPPPPPPPAAVLQFPDAQQPAGLPVASCLLTRAPIGKVKDDGTQTMVIRPYTPISRPSEVGHLDLAIKVYPSGELGMWVRGLTNLVRPRPRSWLAPVNPSCTVNNLPVCCPCLPCPQAR